MISLSNPVLRKQLALLFMATFIIRATVFFFYVQHERRYHQPDSIDYHNGALGITLGTGMHRPDNLEPIFWRTPGYPLYIAFFYKLFGLKSTRFENNRPAHKAALWVQLFLCSLLPLLIFFLAYVLTQSSTISWITAWISAFHLGLVLASMFFLSEGLALIFFYLYLLFFYKSFSVYGEPEKPAAYKNLAYAALALGIGTWIRPMGEFIAFITFLLIAVLGRDTLKKKGKKILLFALIFFGSISPWYIRNYQLTGKCFFCPMLGPYLTSFVAPKVMRRAYDMPLAQSINMLYNLSDKKRAEQTQALRGTGKMVPRETPCVSVALPIILKYPWYTFQEWMKEVFKTAFDLYSSQLVAFAKKTNHYDPIEEFLFVKIRDCLYAQPMPPLMRLICWLELLFALLLWIGIIAGTALFLIFPLCKRTALSHNGFLFLKTLPIIGAICFITGGFGYARLRLPVEPLMILLALTFWCWVIAQKKQTVKQKRVTA